MTKKQAKTSRKRVGAVRSTTRQLAYDVDSAARAVLLPAGIIRGLIRQGLLPVSRIAGRVLIQEKSLLKVLNDAAGTDITTQFLNSGSLDDGYVDVTAESSAREGRAGNNAVEGPTIGRTKTEEQSK